MFQKGLNLSRFMPPNGSLLNYSHPLAKFVRAYWPMGDCGNGYCWDVAHNLDESYLMGTNTVANASYQCMGDRGAGTYFSGGSGSGGTFPVAAANFASANYTISFYVYGTASNTGTVLMVAGGGYQVTGWYLYFSTPTSLQLVASLGTSVQTLTATLPVVPGWFHVVFSVSNGNGTAYVSGVQSGTGTNLNYSAFTSGGFIGKYIANNLLFVGGLNNLMLLDGYAMTAQDAYSFYQYPYQLLQPAGTNGSRILAAPPASVLAGLSTTNLAVWLRADNGAYQDAAGTTPCTNGTAVTRWNDFYKLFSATQATVAAKPTYTSSVSALNGMPALFFTPSTSFMMSGYNAALGNFTSYVVFVPVVAGNSITSRLIDKNFATGFWMGSSGTGQTWGGGVMESTSPYGEFVTAPNNIGHILSMQRSGTTQSVWSDGANLATQTCPSTVTDLTQLGIGGDSGVGYGTGYIAEILIYNVAHTTAQRQAVETYLAGRYALPLAEFTPTMTLTATGAISATATMIGPASAATQTDYIDTLQPVNLSAPMNTQHPLNQGRLIWWLTLPGLDGGSRWYDIMGTNNGVLTSMSNANNGWRGTTRPGGTGHMQFNASGSSGCVIGPVLSTTSGNWTIACWLKCAPTTANYPIVFSANAYNGGGITAPDIYITQAPSSAQNCIFGGIVNGSVNISTFATAATVNNLWHRIVYTANYVTGTGTLYVDGVLIGSSTGSWTPFSMPTAIEAGYRFDGTIYTWWSGCLDDCSIWSRVLTPVEIQQDYLLSQAGYPGVLNRLSRPTGGTMLPLIGNANLVGRGTLTAWGQMPGPYTPGSGQIIGLFAWYQASDLSGLLTNGASVSSWQDDAPNGNPQLQSNASLQPTYIASGNINGGPVVRYPLTAAVMNSGAGVINSPATVYIVKTEAVNTTDSVFFRLNGYSPSAAGWAIGENTPSYGRECIYSDAGNKGLFASSVPTSPHIGCYIVNGSSSYMFQNGVQVLSGIQDPILAIGCQVGDATTPWAGDIAEIIVFSGAHTTAQRQAVETYLAGKYGISIAVYSPTAGLTGTAALAATGTLGGGVQQAIATLTGSASVAALPVNVQQAIATLAGAATVMALPVNAQQAIAALAGSASVAELPVNIQQALATITGAASLYAAYRSGAPAVLARFTNAGDLLLVNDVIEGNYASTHTQSAFSLGTMSNVTAYANASGPDGYIQLSGAAGSYASSGTYTSPPLSIGSLSSVGASNINWTATIPTGCTLAVTTSVDGGTTWQSATSGSPIAGLSADTGLAPMQVLQVQIAMSTTNANVTPQVTLLHYGVDAGKAFFNNSGAVVTALLVESTPYMNAALADSPSCYLRLHDPSGSNFAADVSGNNLSVSAYPSIISYQHAGAITEPGNVGMQLTGSTSLPNLSCSTFTPATNTFTIEAWVSIAVGDTITLVSQSTSGITGTTGQRYFWYPTHGSAWGAGHAGMGVSLGTNGIQVFEQAAGYMPALAAYHAAIPAGWHHVVVVYNAKTPTIYLDGTAVQTGLTSTITTVHPPQLVGGMVYGVFSTILADELAAYPVALSSTRIQAHYNAGVAALVKRWSIQSKNNMMVPRNFTAGQTLA